MMRQRDGQKSSRIWIEEEVVKEREESSLYTDSGKLSIPLSAPAPYIGNPELSPRLSWYTRLQTFRVFLNLNRPHQLYRLLEH